MPADGDAVVPPLRASSDEETPGRARRFDALVEGYGRVVSSAVARVLGSRSRHQQEDVKQEVMLALWRRLGREQSIDAPASYLYKAAVREAVRAVHRLRQQSETPLEDAPTRATMTPPVAEDLVVKQEQTRALEAALNALTTERARAVRAYLAGMSIDETMHLYGWSYQRARNLVARGLADVKRAIRQKEGL